MKKCFALLRAALTPPEVLLKFAFPTIDEWQWKLKNGVGVEHNLLWMAIYACPDAAFMMDDHPHPFFQHPLFSTPHKGTTQKRKPTIWLGISHTWPMTYDDFMTFMECK
jgi:hypothetical protein